jgi:cytochrome c oxidase accessory protein FixG
MSSPPPAAILGSMRPDGSRLVVHPADVRGRWIRWRRWVFALLVAIYAGMPLIPIGGHPSIQLDVEHRRFYLLGSTFNAQDFWIVVLILLAFVFGLLFLTAWRGRVWCGWACPQTVFLEGVYRTIERWIDGPRERRLKAAAEPWTAGRALRFAAKQAIFLAASLNIAHAAAAIFVGPRELLLMIREGPSAHWTAFSLVMGFTAVLTINFAWFREQFCVVLCPYGRLQSVFHDRDSVTVAYDEPRGEPRGKMSKNPTTELLGDCVDCRRCVVVCPTAIDIRGGLQMECLACLQCVDACDEVMERVGRRKGLIGLYSQNQLATGRRKTLRPRLAIYGALFLLTAGALAASFLARTPFEANILRPRGAMPFVVDGDEVRNAFEIHLVNKHPETATFRVRVASPVEAEVVIGTPEVTLASLADAHVPISVSIEREHLDRPVELTVEIEDTAAGTTTKKPYRFLAPFAVHDD